MTKFRASPAASFPGNIFIAHERACRGCLAWPYARFVRSMIGVFCANASTGCTTQRSHAPTDRGGKDAVLKLRNATGIVIYCLRPDFPKSLLVLSDMHPYIYALVATLGLARVVSMGTCTRAMQPPARVLPDPFSDIRRRKFSSGYLSCLRPDQGSAARNL